MDATVQTYITQLSNGEADLTLAQGFYNDVLGQINNAPVITHSSFIGPGSDLSFLLPEGNVRLLFAFSAGSNNQQMGELSIDEADWLVPTWRAGPVGVALNFVRESFDRLKLFTVPRETALLSFISTFNPATTIPKYLQMPIALLVLGMEYARESDHQNILLSKSCTSLGQLLLKAVLK